MANFNNRIRVCKRRWPKDYSHDEYIEFTVKDGSDVVTWCGHWAYEINCGLR